MKVTSTHYALLIVVFALAVIIGGSILQKKKATVGEGTYTQFAACLTEKGAKFYGAFWCPHCQAQKTLFGDAATILPYVECSTQDKQNQTQICIDEKITGYPTWKFSDESTQNGLLQLQQLADKTGCVLPK